MSDYTLVNTYKRYKAGTQKLVRWLTESASRCHTDSPNSSRKPRVARKIRTAELVACTEHIVAAKDPRVEVPPDILDVTKVVITGCTCCVEFYASLSQGADLDPSLLAANASHKHFLGVRVQIFDILTKEHETRRPERRKEDARAYNRRGRPGGSIPAPRTP
ncbi:hypothetical protein DOTSEDRAFT_161092 [Dothistroma septosporum NZE10]|uniref:DUF6604 domain-containing protein n=1 Tax=Dothistroma septosporum (strain NZE10 / CBS 128990) TaxID=675120 RepID=N1PBY8_DOTSN|nr:hypothetical protein DOTSEDRAFT_161092 [Dothistroma septosporum NZE10]